MKICTATILIICVSWSLCYAANCVFSSNRLAKNHPLILKPGTSKDVYADAEAYQVSLTAGENVELSCPGTDIELENDTITTNVIATCISENNFSVLNKTVPLSTIHCSEKIENVARYTNKICKNNTKEVEIGFVIDSNRFQRAIGICFNDIDKSPLYSYYNLTKSIDTSEVHVARPAFTEEDFYKLNTKLNTLYKKAHQRVNINKQLGLPEGSTKYIGGGNFYLAKGHLTAKTDFVYGPQQIATFHYVNTAPQWQGLNLVNWFGLERNVRTYAADNKVDLVVYTGVYGVTTLPHETTGEDVELFLYVDENNNSVIPIPELFWKIVYNPPKKEAVAVLGVNNPYIVNVSKSVICDDIADSLNWLTMDKHDIKSGYMYACSYEDFKKVVENAPILVVDSILK